MLRNERYECGGSALSALYQRPSCGCKPRSLQAALAALKPVADYYDTLNWLYVLTVEDYPDWRYAGWTLHSHAAGYSACVKLENEDWSIEMRTSLSLEGSLCEGPETCNFAGLSVTVTLSGQQQVRGSVKVNDLNRFRQWIDDCVWTEEQTPINQSHALERVYDRLFYKPVIE